MNAKAAAPASEEGQSPPTVWARSRNAIQELVSWRIVSMLVVLLVLTLAFNFASDGIFASPRNVSLLLRQASLLAILASGVSLLMVMGEIDLSIGSAVFLASTVAAQLQVQYGFSTPVAILGAVVAGAAMGVWQGFWLVRFGIPSFVVTLAGLLGFQGLGLLWTNASTIGPMTPSFVALSEAYLPGPLSFVILTAAAGVAGLYIVRPHLIRREHRDRLALPRLVLQLLAVVGLYAFGLWTAEGFLGIPTALLWVAGIGFIGWFGLTKTTYGRNAYVIGANRQAAILAGIPVRRHLLGGFLFMGVLYGVGGVLQTARLDSAAPSVGQFLALDAIAAAVIGGTSLMGGIGSVTGAMFGALLLSTIDNGMSILNMSSFAQLVLKGLILLGAVALDQYANRRRMVS